MTLLNISRNLAILVILAVAGLSLNSRPVAAQTCILFGGHCTSNLQCCHFCAPRGGCACKPHGMQCTTSRECCAGNCFRVYGNFYACSG
jgi:hypothetical protein